MKQQYKALIAGFIVLGAGCASQPAYKPMPAEAFPKITNTQLVVGLAQKEIRADINQSNMTGGMGGGLLWAIVDTAVNNSRAGDAEKSIGPLRDQLLDFNFEKHFVDELSGDTAGIPWLEDKNILVLSDVSSKSYDKTFIESDKDAVLFLTTDYELTPDFSILKVTAEADLYGASADLKRLQYSLYKGSTKIRDSNSYKTDVMNSLYRNRVTFSFALDQPASTKEEAVKSWSEDSAKRARSALDTGIKAVVKTIIDDLVAASQGKNMTNLDLQTAIKVNNYTIDGSRDAAGVFELSAYQPVDDK